MKKNKKNWLKLVTILFAIMISIMSIGYAFFTEELTINGTVNTKNLYEGESLPTSPVVLDTENNRYYVQDQTKNGMTFKTESWEGDTYTLNIQKGFLLSAGGSSITYSISFQNPTVLTMTNGTVTAEITENTGNMLKDVTAEIDKTEIAPGETVTISMTLTANITWRHNTETAKATVTYNLAGEEKKLYFIVTYTT